MRCRIALICVALWGVTCVWAGGGAVNPAELLEAYIEALNDGDVDAEMALFSDHRATVSAVDGRVAVGLTAIRQSLQVQDYEALVLRSARFRNLGGESYLIFATLGPTKGTPENPGENTVLLSLVVKMDGDALQIVHQHVTTTEGLTPP